MPSVPDALKALKNRLSQPRPFIWLIEVRIPSSPETMVRITPNPKAVTFGTNLAGDPITYDPFPVGIGVMDQDSEGGLATFSITVGGITREIMALLMAYDFLTGQKVNLRLVHEDHLDDPTAQVAHEFEVTNVDGDERAVTFALSSDNLYNWFIPSERIARDFCGFTYRGLRCGFTGDPTDTLGDCARTYEACILRGDWEEANGYTRKHPNRFGGAPAMSE